MDFEKKLEEIIKSEISKLNKDEEFVVKIEVVTDGKINQVSIRLVNERPLLSEEQLTSPEKVAMVVGDYIRDLDREALCVINFNSKLQPIFTIESRKFFAFGGASSHDISDGILCPDNWKEKAKELERQGKYGFRVKDISWWKEELPTEEEMKHGMDVLKEIII